MKKRLIIYSLLFVFLVGIGYLVLLRRQAPTGLSTGYIRKYSLIKRNVYMGTPSGLLANDKGFIYATKTSDRYFIIQTDRYGNRSFVRGGRIINRGRAVIDKISLSTNPSGSKLCIVWSERFNQYQRIGWQYFQFTKLYYRFIDLESGYSSSAREIDKVMGLSNMNVLYNDEQDEFAIFYTTRWYHKYVIVNSYGYNYPARYLSIYLYPWKMKIIWNEYEHVYAILIQNWWNSYRLIQVNSHGYIVADNYFKIGNIYSPKSIYFRFNPIDYVYDIFISQGNTLFLVKIDRRANVLSSKQIVMPYNFSGEFDVVDNGQTYDLVYCTNLWSYLKGINYTLVSYSGEYSNRYNKITDFRSYGADIAFFAALSNGYFNILCTTEWANTTSFLGVEIIAEVPYNLSIEEAINKAQDDIDNMLKQIQKGEGSMVGIGGQNNLSAGDLFKIGIGLDKAQQQQSAILTVIKQKRKQEQDAVRKAMQ